MILMSAFDNNYFGPGQITNYGITVQDAIEGPKLIGPFQTYDCKGSRIFGGMYSLSRGII